VDSILEVQTDRQLICE